MGNACQDLARVRRSGRMTIAHRFIGGMVSRYDSQSVKRTAELEPAEQAAA